MYKRIMEIKSFIERKVILGLKIPRDALVLDLGSGEKPFWRADVYVDDISQGNNQRATDKAIEMDLGYFVNSNAEKLPFPDNSFDYVYCSHLLEHVNNPDLVISEILRITKNNGGGYIEVPNAVLEIIGPHDAHIWNIFFSKFESELIFLRKSKNYHDSIKKNLSYVLPRKRCLTLGNESLFTQLFWRKKDGFKYRIHNDLKDDSKYIVQSNCSDNAEEKITQSGIDYYKFFRVFLRKVMFLQNRIKFLDFISNFEKELKNK